MFARTHHILHLGRHKATVTRRRGVHLEQVSECSLEGVELSAPEGLSAQLLNAAQSVQGRSHWTLLLDSCWLPITTIQTANEAWMPHELKALACHRWTTLYGDALGPWLAQTAYLPGDLTATAFGISARLKVQLAAFSKEIPGKAVSVQPSLLWAFDHFARTAKGNRLRRAWLWCEQDRCVTAVGQHGHLQVLAPGLDKRTADGALEALVPVNLSTDVDAIVVAGLHPSVTMMDSAPQMLHGKPLSSYTLLAPASQGAAP